eukprot:CAMPEP_0198239760 /NCGR_PEP_ID=MMETSP1446-20131203/5070_1 /TAXON_ID=1461542 ORGANISM="Unidentified sp, Strain CCMP2111" /NCGR_SAMPLE_ID=MMETSP1446 /ASSEMBLY_ACC=CAM_ASM_001112 /LENGTH=495 /DNA_ID=CAMNT_0043922397 /DNA_START=440 /DNA_END=1927 /DNA_ORIENTATION=+
MGANCGKAFANPDSRSHDSTLCQGKGQKEYAEPETRNLARFLAPETRRAGSSPLALPEYGSDKRKCIQLGDPQARGLVSTGDDLTFDKDSGAIVWNCKQVTALAARMETFFTSSGRYGATNSGNDYGQTVFSPQFYIPYAGQNRWRLVWSICDVNDCSASLYLQCCNPEEASLFGPLHTKFTLGIRRSQAIQGICSSSVEMNLAHCFTKDFATWGIQEIISADETAEFIDKDTKSIQVFLRLVLVSSVPPIISSESSSVSSKVAAELISEEPRILLFEDFLDESECEALMNLARPELQRSRVATGTETPSRTSHGTFLTGRKESEAVVMKVEEKIARCLKERDILKDGQSTRKPLVKSEALQVVRYRPGEFYKEHYDNKAGNASHRAATFMIYLSDVEAGGSTYFPRSSGRPVVGTVSEEVKTQSGISKVCFWNSSGKSSPLGLRIYPKQGRAILFWSRLPTGSEDMSSIHAAETVLSGEKWILTRWMREIERDD